MGVAADVRQIQHLAAMGLGSRIAIPEMLAVRGRIIPGAFNSFFWLNADGEPTDAYVPYILPGALAALACLPEDEPTFDKVLAVGQTVGSTLSLHAGHDYSASMLCNEVWRPYGIGCALDLVLRDRGVPRAILYVNREAHLSRFSVAERRFLHALAPHFMHALDAPAERQHSPDETEEESATLILAPDASIVSSSAGAMQMLLAMSGRAVVTHGRPATWERAIVPVLAELLRLQRGIDAGRPGLPTRLERVTPSGVFRARAYAQDRMDGGAGELLTVTISRHLPRAVRLTRRLAALDLSPREREVAFRLAQGANSDVGAGALGISIASWRSYTKRVYQRLGVTSRGEFHALLQAR